MRLGLALNNELEICVISPLQVVAETSFGSDGKH